MGIEAALIGAAIIGAGATLNASAKAQDTAKFNQDRAVEKAKEASDRAEVLKKEQDAILEQNKKDAAVDLQWAQRRALTRDKMRSMPSGSATASPTLGNPTGTAKSLLGQ